MRFLKWLFLCFSLAGFRPVFSQAKHQLKEYISLAEKSIEQSDYQKGEEIIQKGLPLYLFSKDLEQKARFAFVAGDVYHYLSKFHLSINYFRESYQLFEAQKEELNTAEAAVGLLETYPFIKQYDDAVTYGYIALKIYEQNGSASDAMEIKCLLSSVLVNAGDFKEAHSLLESALKYYSQQKDELFIASVKEDLGNLYLKQNQLVKSLQLVNEAYRIFKDHKDVDGLITSLNLLSEIYLKLGKPDQALEKSLSIFELLKPLQDQRGANEYRLNLGAVYQARKEYGSALEQYRMFQEMGRKIGDPTTEYRYEFQLINWSKKQGELDAALDHLNRYLELKSAYDQNQQNSLMDDMAVRYNLSQKERELNTAQLQNKLLNEQQKLTVLNRNFWLIILLVIIVLLIAVTAIFRFRHKKKQRELEEDIKLKSKELVQFTQRILEKNKVIASFEEQLEQSNGRSLTEQDEKREALLKMKILTEEDWVDYQKLFNGVYPHFKYKMKQLSSELTEGDVRHLMLVQLNLSTREIADVLGISVGSVRVNRHRIRKKLNMDEDLPLEEILK